ncbi:hypothetical protein MHPYR_180119 [uncultured Mycobacterium sp.]|uniref:Uncharacterized protein n=1 Tax=uncultured Mycobacterium sp. TaxID=171292 RepID=A0A1Y5P5D5_9MYCO|nr:hypothetical protein MHPYR_180119 [uncultured Mycobacterium sp.]
MKTRQVTWGEALVVELFKTSGGLKVAVDRITGLMGKTVGTRNTFAKLTRVDDPVDLNDKDLWRAWLLLTALGHDPIEWGIDDSAVPDFIDIPDLQKRLLLPRMDSNHQPSD